MPIDLERDADSLLTFNEAAREVSRIFRTKFSRSTLDRWALDGYEAADGTRVYMEVAAGPRKMTTLKAVEDYYTGRENAKRAKRESKKAVAKTFASRTKAKRPAPKRRARQIAAAAAHIEGTG